MTQIDIEEAIAELEKNLVDLYRHQEALHKVYKDRVAASRQKLYRIRKKMSAKQLEEVRSK